MEFKFLSKYYMNLPKAAIIDLLKNQTLCGDIMLEPRLHEYLKKKLYYKEHDLQPCIAPELEFQITHHDKRIIKAFLAGKKDIYTNPKYSSISKQKTSNRKQYFPSSKLRKDSRVPDIENLKPVEINSINSINPINRGMFVPDANGGYYEDPNINNYNMISPRDFPPYVYDGSGFDIETSKFNPRIDPKIWRGVEKYNKDDSQYKIPLDPCKDKHSKCLDPRNKYIISDLFARAECIKDEINQQNVKYCNFNTQEPDVCDYNITGRCNNGPMTRYGNDPIPDIQMSSEMDIDNKVVIPNMKNNSGKELGNNNYRFETYFANNPRDNDLESELLRGMPTYRTQNRSYGYRNPEEHYFEYIDADFQNPINSVMDFDRGGESTRIENKTIAKNRNYTREIM